MRLLSSWEQYLATTDDSGVQLHQYATAEIGTEVGGEAVRLAVHTDYPWQGRITVHVRQSPERPWTLSLRVPQWCRSATLTSPDGDLAVPADAGVARQRRSWRAGDSLVLSLDLPVRVTEPDPRIDAVRGCVAIERGPLVYCLESADAPAGVELEELVWDGSRSPVTVPRPELGGAVVGMTIPVVRRAATDQLTAGAIPYFAWANREAGAMRVWLPGS
jgi:DUF1680 family protein